MNITVDYSFCCWPEADKPLNISLAKMGLFGISREWQFSVCKNRKPRASLCRASEGGHFIEGRGQEGWCNEQSRLFMGWVYAREAGVLPSSVADTGVTSCKSSPFSSVQFSSVAQSCLTLCDPMNRSTPGLPVHHRLPKFTQTHVIESVMPSSHLIFCRPLLLLPQSLPPSGSFPMSQLFTSGGQSIGVSASASVLPMNTQGYSPLGWTGSPTQIEVSVYFSGVVAQLCQTLCDLMDCRPPGFSLHVLFINFLHIPILIRIFLGKHH